jgi:hypothetical protein
MKRIYILVITALPALNSFGQSDTTENTARSNADVKKSTLTFGASYSNNVNYYGQRAVDNMPYVLASASWRHSSGIYFTGAGYKLLKERASAVSASSLGAGVGFNIGKDVSADLNYSHTFYPAGSLFVQAANANNASASLSIEKWLTTTTTVDYAFGKTQDVFASFNMSKFVSLGSLFDSSDLISITPGIEVVGGTRHFYQNYITEKRLQDSLAGVALPPLLGGSTNETATTKASTSFDLVSYSFRLPIAYNRASYQFEIAYQFSMLSKPAASETHKSNSFFTVSFYYQF